ncbi:major facilitator superfamily domain-containing protein [Collybia nuda]|uniref:Major facilitator superfamily domain-containing protein n=1 Tax=Collybia nuda TaxID=64659 RepID=A0A9P6CLJ9_9AGAR|nr:major facilitator superfamily domain-containing protein [Collybia nuda]
MSTEIRPGIQPDTKGNTSIETEVRHEENLTSERQIMRKVDWRLLPLLGMLYALALIDRTNLGVARIAGMDRDLRLSKGIRYSIVSAIYFVPYIVLQLPSNLVLRQFGVSNWLAFCVVLWGAVQLAMGFVPTWGLLALCRALLGAFEAGFFPALVFIITTWYKRHEVQKRLAGFYIISILAGGFSAIFAYVLSLLGGKLGLAGWSWIFIVEGAITIVFGAFAWFYIPDFPDKNTFLNEEQTSFVLRRVENDRGDSTPDTLSTRKLLEHLSDWKIWVFGKVFYFYYSSMVYELGILALMYMCVTVPAYAIGLLTTNRFFVTIILRGMGWSVKDSLLLSAPPYVFSAISIMFFAWMSDKYQQRALFIAIQTFITLVGLFLTCFSSSSAWRYTGEKTSISLHHKLIPTSTGLFFSNAGSSGCVPAIIAYASNNIISHTKRAVTTALVVSFGGIGGIFATTVFRQKDNPRFLPGIYATIACQFLLLALLAITTLYFWYQNKKGRVSGKPIEGKVGFLYTL